ARRAERAINVLARKQKVAPEVLAYLNRLSSYLYALARQQAGKKEQHPTYA
ncbi:MAG: ATP:cob(I)alamin adenosyltransferase, partial [bacterium]|nr:ATP:cob(I)alamin adenosyltransferase [bacterium]